MHMDGTVVRWVVEVQTGTLYYKLYGYNAAGTAVVSSSSLIMGGSGQLVWVLQVKQSGTSIDWTLTNNSGIVQSGTLASNTTGSIRSVQFAPGGDLTGASIGHVHVSSDIYTSTLWNAALDYGYGSGFSQEKADTRVKRLCAALGTPITLTCPQVNSTDAGEPMGWPPSGTFWSRLADCATADGGLLADSPFDKALEFYTQRYLYTTSVAMTLDTATGHIASPPELTLDDQKLVTDATITRQGGSSARYATSSTEGEYTSSQTLNIGTDPRALPAAEWAVAVGTNTDARIPKLTVNLRRNTSLIASWFLTRFGQRLRVTTPPSDVGPGEKGTNSAAGYDYMIQGWTEYLGYYDWRVDFNLTPARPWTVGYLGASASRVLENQGGLAVNTPGYNTTATSIQVIGAGTDTMPLLSTTSADYPRSVLAATGEEMTVTAVSGSSWPQTLTVTRSVNGVVKTLPTATRIYLTQPFRWSK
jgi:hypothetical protein